MTNPNPPARYTMSRRLNGLFLEPGTIVGPNGMNEFLCAVDIDALGTTFRYATVNDIADASRRIRLTGDVRSVAEHRVIQRVKPGAGRLDGKEG